VNENDNIEICEIEIKTMEDVWEYLKDEEVPFEVKKIIIDRSMRGKGKTMVLNCVELQEVGNLISDMLDIDYEAIYRSSHYKIWRFNRTLEKMIKETRKFMSELKKNEERMKDYEQSNFDGSSN
jgi:hypothetical protein